MSKINDGGPAFPCGPERLADGVWAGESSGMSIRDYFAAKAMQGILSCPRELYSVVIAAQNEGAAARAKAAYAHADAMLAAREGV